MYYGQTNYQGKYIQHFSKVGGRNLIQYFGSDAVSICILCTQCPVNYTI